MFTITKKQEKFYITQLDGTFLNGWDGSPLRYGKLELAQKVVDRLNNPTRKTTAPAKVTGVMDNRHRNWRRRG